MDQIKFAQKWTEYLKRRKITQEKLAGLSGTNISDLSRLRNFKLPWSNYRHVFDAACKVLGLSEAEKEELEILAGIVELPPPNPNTPAPGIPPYKGLVNYEFVDAEWFFGREKEIGEMVKRLRQTPLLMVVGGSGYGKSSLVRAGLAPAWLGKKGKPYILTPTSDPLTQLASVLTRDIESTTAQRTLIDDMRQDPRTLKLFLLKHHLPETQPDILLIVDQFEELFTLCTDADARQMFLDNLFLAAFPDATENGPLEAPSDLRHAPRIVLALRGDFYEKCLPYHPLRQALENFHVPIGPLHREGLREIIEQPAAKGGWTFERGLVDAILSDCAVSEKAEPERGALPLLSQALAQTWNRRRGRELTFAGYHEAGGVEKAIATTADMVYAGFSDPEKAAAQRIFLALVEYNDDGPDTRRRAALTDLGMAPETQAVLDKLADAQTRLITVEKDQVDVAHEALIRKWDTLQDWLAEKQDARRLHDHLHKAAAAWHRMGRRPDDLYRGLTLARALAWLKDPTPEPAQLERDFLEASRKAQVREMRATRTRRVLLALVPVGLVISLLIAMLGRGFVLKWLYPPVAPKWSHMIEAGTFQMGGTAEDLAFCEELGWDCTDEHPQHLVYLDAFKMMTHEVTHREYVSCVLHGPCPPPRNFPTSLVYADTFTSQPALLQHPVSYITWEMARTYCEWEWIGGFLPTEAQWEGGARGGEEGNLFPWGDDLPVCDRTAENGGHFGACNNGEDGQVTVPVGSFSPNGFGLYDMAGNVWEWVADWYGEYPDTQEILNNPKGPDAGDIKVLRGGSWDYDESFLRSADRYRDYPTNFNFFVGFRCARSP